VSPAIFAASLTMAAPSLRPRRSRRGLSSALASRVRQRIRDRHRQFARACNTGAEISYGIGLINRDAKPGNLMFPASQVLRTRAFRTGASNAIDADKQDRVRGSTPAMVVLKG
jgi:hypothetical protein